MNSQVGEPAKGSLSVKNDHEKYDILRKYQRNIISQQQQNNGYFYALNKVKILMVMDLRTIKTINVL
ncbi:hypothetical protein AJGP001_16345 [Planococcus faecalis]|uniref:Uncharacterized protein n=1 Tax=Planococcus faecalis TaxID=1598147 RepID=A0ABN4XM32_9BACL|nr:hypothetical protein AJGP001_16345 [Planococcus faecalis]OHX55749.1 hypothetical protein BB777_00920 [Planococcus faecalis]